MFLPLMLAACLPGSSDKAPYTSAGEVIVEGNIKNDVVAWKNYIPDFFKRAFAATTISTRSSLIVEDPTRLADVSVAVGIVLDADVVNSTATSIEGYKVDIFIEDEQRITKENWDCSVCYNISDGTTCEGLLLIKGNTIFESDPTPTLPTCDAGTGSQALCVTFFPNTIDCANPTYSWIYTEAGDGLQKFTMEGISVEALSNAVYSVGQQSSGWPVGTDKYGRFTLYNENSVFVMQKDYVFNVIN